MPLATTDDLEARLGRVLTEAEQSRAGSLLDDVSAAVELVTGRRFATGSHTLRTRVKWGVVRLPQRPVVTVDSVTNIDGDDVAYVFDGIDRVRVTAGNAWTDFETYITNRSAQVVDVTYTAGADTVPPAIIGVVCGIVLRSLGVNPTESAVTQESVDGYSYTIGSAGGAGPYGVLPAEAKILDYFTRPAPSIWVAM